MKKEGKVSLKITRYTILLPILASVLLLQACMVRPLPAPDLPPEPQLQPAIEELDVYNPAPVTFGNFTLLYDSDSPLNPITGFSSDNIRISSLLYEPLFMLDSNLNTVPVLSTNWTTEDNITHVFEIMPDVAMSDGTMLTAEDVVYSLSHAMTTGRFIHRLSIINNIHVSDELTVTIVLNTANSRLPSLLDVPIIKSGSIHMDVPPGTGPFVLSPNMRLYGFPQHRDFARLPISHINLLPSADAEASELFDNGILSLIWDDPGGIFEIRINRFHEARFYNTTRLQFLGFSTRLPALRNPDVRSAIGHSVERDYIANEIMPGLSLVSPLALSPAYRLYNTDWEFTAFDPFREMAALLTRAGMLEDVNGLFLLYPDGYGGFQPFVIDFIVNRENTFKVRSAHRIADTLGRNGINVAVRELPWEDFLHALSIGDFDMFYGETHLTPDFDLSPLLLPNGMLNFGGTGSEAYRMLLQNFLSASTDDEEAIAARMLVEEIRLNAPFVPILYRRHAVFTPVGAVSHFSPSQSGVFLDFANWSIDLTLLA
jgi:peptide/nickel transport system substrate-binding protein